MKTYKQAQAEIARLQREAQTVKQAEATAAVEKFKKLIALYGLTAADLGLDGSPRSGTSDRPARKAASKPASRGRKASARKTARSGAGAVKYRDPTSGATWSGFGRAPGWLASAQDREAFRVAEDDGAQPGTSAARAERDAAEPRPAKAARRKADAKAAAKRPTARKRASAKPAPAQQAAPPSEGSETPPGDPAGAAAAA